jgi:hypothetical protein
LKIYRIQNDIGYRAPIAEHGARLSAGDFRQ